MKLSTDLFPAFFAEVHGFEPFPWQSDLVTQVMTAGRWPAVIDVPTGMGKTSMIDVAVFLAAVTACDGGGRVGRRRLFFVVDRRIVVDEAHDHALALSDSLERADASTVVGRVATELRTFAPGVLDAVLPVVRMRGGVTWSAAWLRRPDLPAVVVGTVDQIGSRFLFRGYGVSDRRRPLDAALVGTDSLIVVDEAHLAEAMATTVVEAYRRDASELDVPSSVLIRMSATPGHASSASTYALDVGAHRADPEAWRRLTAAKRLHPSASEPRTVVGDLVAAATSAVVDRDADTALVVCNTVGRARDVFTMLTRATDRRIDPLGADVCLLIGRSRPIDREGLTTEAVRRFGLQRERGGRAAILVATQTVEVGANLDVDALITESASWDALVQRLGRLNRLGRASASVDAVIVHAGPDDRSVYGSARDSAWEFILNETDATNGAGVDVSPLACRELSSRAPSEAFAHRSDTPLLTRPIVDAWTRTGPIPNPDAPIAPYLHGLGRGSPSVSLVWRAGLVQRGGIEHITAAEAAADLAALPIRAPEVVDVPLHAVRAWVEGLRVPTISDLENDIDAGTRARQLRPPFDVLVHRPGDRDGSGTGPSADAAPWVWVGASALRPGDTIVVPCERGGLDRFGWAPESVAYVTDAVEAASVGSRRRGPRLRLDEDLLTRLTGPADDGDPGGQLALDALRGALDPEDHSQARDELVASIKVHVTDLVGRFSASIDAPHPGVWTLERCANLLALLDERISSVPIASLDDSAGVPRWFLLELGARGPAVERDDEEPESSSLSPAKVTLDAHQTAVAVRARQIADGLGLHGGVRDTVEFAARWHDVGKAERRFQAMLCGGDAFRALVEPLPLAKSGMPPSDRAAFRAARLRSGLPRGARHEAWSAALVLHYLNGSETDPGDVDVDLAVHLVASHHGHARPWLPPIHDPNPRKVVASIHLRGPSELRGVAVSSASTVLLEHPTRFARLNARYGRWGLALLELIVRSADMTVSEEGS